MEPPPLPQRTANHDRIYTTILAAFSGFVLFGLISLTTLMNRPGIDERGRWALSLARNMEACFLVAALIILIVRIKFPEKRKWITLVFNIIMLAFFPFGTALSIYAFLKVDKGGS